MIRPGAAHQRGAGFIPQEREHGRDAPAEFQSLLRWPPPRTVPMQIPQMWPGKKNARRALKEIGASAKRNSAQGAIHAPAQRSRSRYLDESCSSRGFFIARSHAPCKQKLFTFDFAGGPFQRRPSNPQFLIGFLARSDRSRLRPRLLAGPHFNTRVYSASSR